jgi:penicillin-binding protein 1A
MRSSGVGSILEAFKPGTAPPDSYGESSGVAQDGGAPVEVERNNVGSGTGGLY